MARILVVTVGVALACLAIPAPAHAYLEPGTTTMFVQMIVGAIVGGLFAIKLYFKRLIGFFRRTSEPAEEPAEGSSASSPSEERRAASNE